MGKNKWTRHVDHEDENIHPGCMWGLIHAFGYHSWHSRVKKKSLPRIGSDRLSKERFLIQDSSELEMLLDDNESQFLVDKSTRNSGLPNKRSLKAKIKALIAEEMHKGKKRSKQKKSGSSNQPKFQRNSSIHHYEPTENDLSEICSNKNVENGATSSLDKKQIKAIDEYDTSIDKNALKFQLKDHAELFLEILRETEVGYQNFSNGQLTSKKKARLTKSGSYPVSHLSQRTNFKPSKLEDKKNEVWSFAKGERLTSGAQSRSLSNYAKTLFTSLGLLDDDGGNVKLEKSSSFACHSINGAVDNKENNEELVDVEEANKHGSTYELFEDLNGDLHEEHKVGTDYESKSNSYCEIDGFDIRKTTIVHRRSSSLNESMDRYTKLFKHTSKKEVNLNPSRSLKLTSEYEMPFRRIRSLSNGVPGDAQFSEWLIRTLEETNSHIRAETEREAKSIYNPTISYASEETGSESEKVERIENSKTVETTTSLKPKTNEEGNAEVEDLSENINDVTVFKGNSYKEQEMKCSESILSDVLPNSEEEDIPSCEEFQISEGLVLKHNVDVDTLAKADRRNKSYRKENADLFYVRDILEHSGFSSNFFKTTWYSAAQVLNPSVIQELESFWHQEQEYCCLDDFYFCCHHHLLFDLVNEVLVQIYDRSFTYYAKALSYSCRVRPLPENRMVEEVCKNVGTLLRLKPEQESIDAIVDRDLKKDDGWMNLQLESECLALELEDMIFNDLLEELSCP
ncbi:protein TRM32-like [Nicotiana tomentosiformis]|uniref:protein TRM32-like n=1 Tax=Nicotiana tomentosiformis TaxID=4098 RepID=UPI00051AF9A5|nr:protein TRM32-like [Nicotiana tomentosiformis]XP_009609445.1 protein TRM32-like [Nicotiana tomentosiformis]